MELAHKNYTPSSLFENAIYSKLTFIVENRSNFRSLKYSQYGKKMTKTQMRNGLVIEGQEIGSLVCLKIKIGQALVESVFF